MAVAVPLAIALRVRWWMQLAARKDNELPGAEKGEEHNRQFYDRLWAEASLVDASRFNTWPLVERLARQSAARLEVGPGLRPRLPINGTEFVDLSQSAVDKLRGAGASANHGTVTALDFADESFDLVTALDVIEHVENDRQAFAEISRVLRPGGRLLISVPLHQGIWSGFDDFVGHMRRYEPSCLLFLLRESGFEVERSARYGMQPRSPQLAEFGIRCLVQRPGRAIWYYSRVFMPVGLWFQNRLQHIRGLIDLDAVDEVLLVCRKVAA